MLNQPRYFKLLGFRFDCFHEPPFISIISINIFKQSRKLRTAKTSLEIIMTRLIDSHIHLYSQSDNESLAWMTPINPLAGTFDPARYSSCSSSSDLTGYIFVETDRSYPSPISATADGLKNPLNEISMALDIFTSSNSKLLGMVPFAPLPLGSAGMQSWWDLALKLGDSPTTVEKMVRGVRYLVQDKPRGTLSCPGFVEGVKWTLGKGMVFELGVDTRSTGLWQLEETVEVMGDVMSEGQENGEGRGWVVIGMLFLTSLNCGIFC
jgi:L-rhamnono-1,4-lactonase